MLVLAVPTSYLTVIVVQKTAKYASHHSVGSISNLIAAAEGVALEAAAAPAPAAPRLSAPAIAPGPIDNTHTFRMTEMTRRLSRRAKDLVCMRQLATCGYCARDLCDAFEVDHINECRTDDRECNLVAACALCHAIKSRHVRLGRDWTEMKVTLEQNRLLARDRWRDGQDHGHLPEWLQARVNRLDARVYQLSLQPAPSGALDLEQYRYNAKPRPGHRSGSPDV